MSGMMLENLKLRRETCDDAEFLRLLYRVSRDYELSQIDAPEFLLVPFFEQQYALQQVHYEKCYPRVRKAIIEYEGTRIGKVYTDKVNENGGSLRVIDITIDRPWRGKGIGKHIIKVIQEEARDAFLPLTLHVHKLNPAVELYKKLGFRVDEHREQHVLMKWYSNQFEAWNG
ncbi:GNAT family N-acetyltransferase [uncultured Photobacterium sp.]|uniref:GNAT family N-acetyltransferase n=1 Tax=uncultured Photobacterium sp. TaxID=173973 RepID=UPI0026193BD2|nr:GNAT family N-acetyltransferase [uncultured Photobacterium sp.]